MMFMICSINMESFEEWKCKIGLENLNKLILITNVAKSFTISPNLFIEPKCATFKAFTTTKTI